MDISKIVKTIQAEGIWIAKTQRSVLTWICLGNPGRGRRNPGRGQRCSQERFFKWLWSEWIAGHGTRGCETWGGVVGSAPGKKITQTGQRAGARFRSWATAAWGTPPSRGIFLKLHPLSRSNGHLVRASPASPTQCAWVWAITVK